MIRRRGALRKLDRVVRRLVTGSAFPLESLTVDVFDTVLLRRVWPEDLQFRTVAERWLEHIRWTVHPSITSFEILSFRRYAREVYWAARKEELRRDASLGLDHEIRADVWFALIVEMLAEKYEISLEQHQINDLIHRMIEIEIEIEIQHLKPNRLLIATLERLKAEHGLDVYFCSDNYLSGVHISRLLGAFEIDVFDGGTTSADQLMGKWSGKLFRRFESLEDFPKFDLASNLHIGDDFSSDFLVPLRIGSHAFHYKTAHHFLRTARRTLGQRRFQRYLRAEHRSISRDFTQRFRRESVGVRVGAVFSPMVGYFTHHLVARARREPDVRFLAVSSEAVIFARAMELISEETPSNVSFAPQVNRKALLVALMAAVIESGDEPRMSALPKLMLHAEGPQTDIETLRILGDAFGELLPSKMGADEQNEFIVSRMIDLLDGSSNQALAAVEETFEFESQHRLTLVDIGWLGTMQVLLRELVAILEIPCEIGGVYLAARRVNPFDIDRGPMEGIVFPDIESVRDGALFAPEIWEYVLSSRRGSADSAKQRAIGEGLERGLHYWRDAIHGSPADFFEAMKGQLVKLHVNPEVDEMMLLGTIEWRSGFSQESKSQIVDFSHDRLRKYIKGWIRPKSSVRDVTNLGPHSWPAAYVKYYRIGHLRPILKYLGRKRGVFYG